MSWYNATGIRVEAIEWTAANHYPVMRFVGDAAAPVELVKDYPWCEVRPNVVTFAGDSILVDTVTGIERAQLGDFIIREEAGFRVMAGNEFRTLYNAKAVSE